MNTIQVFVNGQLDINQPQDSAVTEIEVVTEFRRLVIIGTELEIQQGVAFSRLSPKSVMGSLASFEIRYDLPVLFCATAERAAQQVETWAWYFAVEQVKTVNNLWRSLT